MSKYGYIGKESDIPQQAFKSNAGVLSVNDHLALSQQDKLTQYGQLELIATQTVTTSVASVDFTSLGSYNVHFLTYNNVQCTVDNKFVALQFSVGGTFQTSGYKFAYQYGNASGTFGESKSTTASSLIISLQTGTAGNEKQNGYSYLYSLTDSNKLSYQTMHSMGRRSNPDDMFVFGSGVYSTKISVDGIRIIPEATSNLDTATFSLYGIRYSK